MPHLYIVSVHDNRAGAPAVIPVDAIDSVPVFLTSHRIRCGGGGHQLAAPSAAADCHARVFLPERFVVIALIAQLLKRFNGVPETDGGRQPPWLTSAFGRRPARQHGFSYYKQINFVF